LDCDQHFGDGTAEIIERLQAASWIQHFTAGARFSSRAQATPFLRALPALVRSFEDCDLLLYQAGADPHLRDPLGGWLETEELAERDAIVFRVAKELSLPVAWNLAGGYQRDDHGTIQPVLELHLNTALAWARTHLPRQRVDA
jgi:acetoin utilization deacetylase AcuC-like enzyme